MSVRSRIKLPCNKTVRLLNSRPEEMLDFSIDHVPAFVDENVKRILLRNAEIMALQSELNAILAYKFVSEGMYRQSEVIPYYDVTNAMSKYGITAVTYDVYYLVPVQSMLDMILSEDILSRVSYISDLFDCDDFSKLLSAIVNVFFLINTMGIAYGKVIDTSDGTLVGLHSYNIAPAVDSNGNIKWYVIEPQAGIMTNLDNPVFGEYKYETYKVMFG